MSLKVITIIVVVYALIMWVLIFWVWSRGYKEWKDNRSRRIRRFPARVLDRREVTRPAGSDGESVVDRYLLFEFRGVQKEYRVTPAAYAASRVGTEGTLVLRGEEFEDFEQGDIAGGAQDVYQRMVKR